DAAFDLVYSNVVLQHMEPEYSARYIHEFTRILAPGGVAVFQLPSHLLPDYIAAVPASIADDGFRAEIVPNSDDLTIEAGRIHKVGVRVRNASPVAWPEDRCVHLGGHWRDRDGEMVQRDDGRTALARTLEPGQTVDLTLDVQAPEKTGSYVVELDLVIDGVAWFADKGSHTATIGVDVVTRTGSDAEEEPAPRPVMETYGVRRA